MPGLLTLIGSGETSDRLLNLHLGLFKQLVTPQLAILDTPAGFQLNAAQLSTDTAAYFKKNFSLNATVAHYQSRTNPPDPSQAVEILKQANVIFAGPGSPTYAINQWHGSAVWQTVVERWQAGAQLTLASSAAISISRFALPVYEIHKVGEDLHWADGLDLLAWLGFNLAILPHYNNAEGKSGGYDTRYCFMGEPRLRTLEKLLLPDTVILGLDENTACTFNFDTQTITVMGAGHLTLRYKGQEVQYADGMTLPLDRLTPANALLPPAAAPARAAPPPVQPTITPPEPAVPPKVIQWAKDRDQLRAEKKFAEADVLRNKIAAVGYAVKDSPNGPVFTLTRYNNAAAVPSHIDKHTEVEWSVNLLAHNNGDEILRAARSVLTHAAGQSLEVVIVDNGSNDGTAEAIADLATEHDTVRPVFLAADGGEGAGRNAGLHASRGRLVMILGGHMELTGDVFGPLSAALENEAVGATGSNGLVSSDLFSFNPSPTPEADAVEFYLFAFRRERLKTVGLLDEKFVFYRNIDLDWSMVFKEKGLRLTATANLPLAVHEHPYLRMEPAERDRLSKKNYRRFLEKWRERKDLLLASK
jgi:Glycosyl transferase family 2